jgi:cell division septation protein DedD
MSGAFPSRTARPTVVTIRLCLDSRAWRGRCENRLNVRAEFWSVKRPMIQQQRRQYSRKTLNPLPYINLPSGNGGIVLDVSEQGLRFRATRPVEQLGPIPFSFTAHSKLVSGIGEVVWNDRVKKTYGLRFTDLPYFALEQIRKWPHDSNLRLGIGKDLTLQIPAAGEPASSSADERGTLAALAAKVASGLDRLLPGSFGSKVLESWLPAMGNVLAELRRLFPGAYFPKQNRWLFKTTFALFLGIVVSTLVYVRHREAGELLVRLGTRLSGEASTLTAASTVASEGHRVDDESANKLNVAGPVAQSVPQPVNAAIGITTKETSTETPAPQGKENTARLPKTEAGGKELIVQVAALKDEADARELSDKLRHENFQAFVGTLPVDSFYRVMLGPYADEASARIVLGKLKKAGFDSFIRRGSVTERLGS